MGIMRKIIPLCWHSKNGSYCFVTVTRANYRRHFAHMLLTKYNVENNIYQSVAVVFLIPNVNFFLP
jgi:hypothetical protein